MDAGCSQFRRWSRNGTWAQALTVLHAAARIEDGRTEETPSTVVIDTHLARGLERRVQLPQPTRTGRQLEPVGDATSGPFGTPDASRSPTAASYALDAW